MLGVAAVLTGGALRTAQAADAGDWKDKTISPVINPIYFEDPHIHTEVRPIFMQHDLPGTFKFAGGAAPLGGDVRLYAVQLRYALTDRLGLIATKDGYIEFKPQGALTGVHSDGWANLAAGLKYALIDDRANQFILTPGFTIELPTGSEFGASQLQGKGLGEWNVFLSAAKGWDNLHATANIGLRVPNDMSKQTTQLHYSAQLDYYTCRYFIPFVAVNANTVLNNANEKLLGALDLNAEMYDLINFGSTKAAGNTQATVGGGFRSRLLTQLDLGFAYEAGIASPKGIFDTRFTVDLIWRF